MKGGVDMTIAQRIKSQQNTKEMTRKAIRILEALNEDVSDLKQEFLETYQEEV